MTTRKIDLQITKEVLLYIVNKTKHFYNFDKIVIHNLLYFVDALYYKMFGYSLTKATYIKSANGIIPEDFEKIINKMRKGKEIAQMVVHGAFSLKGFCTNNGGTEYLQKFPVPNSQELEEVISYISGMLSIEEDTWHGAIAEKILITIIEALILIKKIKSKPIIVNFKEIKKYLNYRGLNTLANLIISLEPQIKETDRQQSKILIYTINNLINPPEIIARLFSYIRETLSEIDISSVLSNNPKIIYLPLRDSKLSKLNRFAVDIVDSVLDKFWLVNAHVMLRYIEKVPSFTFAKEGDVIYVEYGAFYK